MRYKKLIVGSLFILAPVLLSISLPAQSPSPPTQPAQTKPAQPQPAANSPCLAAPQPAQPAQLRSVIQSAAPASTVTEPSIHAGEAPSIPIPMSVISITPPSASPADDPPKSSTPTAEPVIEPASPAHEDTTPSGNPVGQSLPPDDIPADEAPAAPSTPINNPPSGSTSLAAEAPHVMPTGGAGYIRPIPAPLAKKTQEGMRPFSTIAIGLKVDSLGPGVEIATPLWRSFNLRTGVNLLAFAYPFNIDGISYSAELHFLSEQLNLDWFPLHKGFHISAGMIYLKNNLSATASAPPGGTFELGGQSFTNSVDDPLNGTATVVYPHSIAPTLMLGFSNLLPRNGKHFSMPYEFGAAFTGAPRVNIKIDGTACTYQGCFDATNAEMQQSLQQENDKLNNSLKSLPVYPIVSLGLAYRF